MSWSTVSPELRDVIETSCSQKQIDALKMKAAGMSTRGIARALDVDPATVRDRLDRAHRRIRAEMARRAGTTA